MPTCVGDACALAGFHEVPPRGTVRDTTALVHEDALLFARKADERGVIQLLRWETARTRIGDVAQLVERGEVRRVPLVADGLAVVREARPARQGVLVEIDMGTVSLARMRRKFEGYWRWVQGGDHIRRFGLPALRVLTVVKGAARLEKLLSLANELLGGRGSRLFWFALQAPVSEPDFCPRVPLCQVSGEGGQHPLFVARPGGEEAGAGGTGGEDLEGRIFIANLSKGRLGEDASMILGSFLLSAFQMATYGRANVPIEARRPFTLYIDEFQSFTTPASGELLSEARKYGLALVLAHQHLAQLDEPLRRAILGNTGSLVAFRLGGEDAELLGQELAPEVLPDDLTRLAAHQLAVRLSVRGTTTRAFTAVTIPPEVVDPTSKQLEIIRRISRERYGREPSNSLPMRRPQMVRN